DVTLRGILPAATQHDVGVVWQRVTDHQRCDRDRDVAPFETSTQYQYVARVAVDVHFGGVEMDQHDRLHAAGSANLVSKLCRLHIAVYVLNTTSVSPMSRSSAAARIAFEASGSAVVTSMPSYFKRSAMSAARVPEVVTIGSELVCARAASGA